MLKDWLVHPLTRGLDIDDPSVTHLRRTIIQQKRFLHQIYQEWYSAIASALPSSKEPVLELGSGAGFLREFIPDLITTEIFQCPGINAVIDGQDLPLADSTLRGIVMVNTLHHVPQPRRFLYEAARCVRSKGCVTMIEPWVTPWSRWVYTRLHHEPFQTEATEWEFPSSGPLSSANGAVPWMIFERDRTQFEQEFPQWRIQMIRPIMPFCYLVSGGVSLRSLMPGWTFRFWHRMEHALQPWMGHLAMFAQIVLVRVGSDNVN